MASSCNEQRQALLACLADSPCMAQGRSIQECMTEDNSCKLIRMDYFLCKRGQLDMRKRMRGNRARGGDAPEPAPEPAHEETPPPGTGERR